LCFTLFGAPSAPAGEAAAAAEAGQLAEAKILPPEPGGKACYRRVYDAQHLRDHPRQKITEMLFLLRVVGYDKQGGFVAKDPDRIAYNFAISLKRRSDSQALREGGDCLGDKSAECVVDCDNGGVIIENSSNGQGLLLRLMDGGIAFGAQCDLKPGLWVKPDADDKAFLLEPAPSEFCEPLEKALLQP
jgi:hypothetical protein